SLMQWSNFSVWLILGGLVLALVSAIVLAIEMLLHRTGPIRWLDFAVLAFAAILSIFNEFIHTRDAWTTVVPSGIILSAIVAVLLIFAGLRGWTVTGVEAPKPGQSQ
ncbi:MAG TPA: DUF2231 domain-containing protein, partial [Edaphobacter sp.]|nr:DUF2231 domain-containing protein [Edaphobacter sp.]